MDDKIIYSCKQRPFCQFRVDVEGVEQVVAFENGSVKLDPTVSEALDALFLRRPQLKFGVIRSSAAEADSLIRELLAKAGPKAETGGATANGSTQISGVSEQELSANEAAATAQKLAGLRTTGAK